MKCAQVCKALGCSVNTTYCSSGPGFRGGRGGPRGRRKDTERNLRRRKQERRGPRKGEPLGAAPGPAWGSLSRSSLPHMFFRILRSSASTPSSCHGDGTLDPVESSLRLATRRQRPACCLPLRGRPAPAAAGLLSPRGHSPPGNPGREPLHARHRRPSGSF